MCFIRRRESEPHCNRAAAKVVNACSMFIRQTEALIGAYLSSRSALEDNFACLEAAAHSAAPNQMSEWVML
jgi:hypothetical protein